MFWQVVHVSAKGADLGIELLLGKHLTFAQKGFNG
jgi:hypothetical protein